MLTTIERCGYWSDMGSSSCFKTVRKGTAGRNYIAPLKHDLESSGRRKVGYDLVILVGNKMIFLNGL